MTTTTKPPRMRIGEIRDTLRRSGWLRNDYSGHTREEFKRANVGERMAAMIAELEALPIAPRFAEEIERRADEIRYCGEVVARWEAAKLAPAVDTRTCAEGGPRHVMLGNPCCQLCGVRIVRAVGSH